MATGIEQRMTDMSALRGRVLLCAAALAAVSCGGASRAASPHPHPASLRQASSGLSWYRVDDPAYSIEGRVITADSLAPLQHVQVGLLDANERVIGSAVTPGDGTFRVGARKAGEYRLIVRRIGYAAAVARVTVTESSGVRAIVVLAPDSVSLMFAEGQGGDGGS